MKELVRPFTQTFLKLEQCTDESHVNPTGNCKNTSCKDGCVVFRRSSKKNCKREGPKQAGQMCLIKRNNCADGSTCNGFLDKCKDHFGRCVENMSYDFDI